MSIFSQKKKNIFMTETHLTYFNAFLQFAFRIPRIYNISRKRKLSCWERQWPSTNINSRVTTLITLAVPVINKKRDFICTKRPSETLNFPVPVDVSLHFTFPVFVSVIPYYS